MLLTFHHLNGYRLFNTEDDAELSNNVMTVLIYIVGSNALNCHKCISTLIKDKNLDLDCPREVCKYLLLTDRGAA